MVVAGGALIGASGLVLFGQVQSMAGLYLAYLVFGVGFACTSLLPGTTLVTRWFARRRGMALALATTGLSAGGVFITPLSARLVASRGIAGAAPWLAAAYLLGILPLAMLLMRPRPEAMGLHPDGDAAATHPLATSLPIDVRSAIRSRFFLLVTAAYTFAMVAQVGAITHHFKLVNDRVGPAVAATAVSMVAGGSICGRLAAGWVLSRVPLRPFSVVLLVVQGLMLGALAVATESSRPADRFGGVRRHHRQHPAAAVDAAGRGLRRAAVPAHLLDREPARHRRRRGRPARARRPPRRRELSVAYLGAMVASLIGAALMWVASREP